MSAVPRRWPLGRSIPATAYIGAVAAVALVATAYAAPRKMLLTEAMALFLVGLTLLVFPARTAPVSTAAPERSGAAAPLAVVAAVLLLSSATLVAMDRFVPVSTPAVAQAPEKVYRVYGGNALEFGASWTPVDPRTIGPQRFRVVAGLPDAQNLGTRLVYGYLDSPASVKIIRPALPLGPDEGAYCSYPGGLQEYVIPDAQNHVVDVQTEELKGYGGKPAASCG